MNAEDDLMRDCPLCGESDYDATGLALHFRNGWCEKAERLLVEYDEARRKFFETRGSVLASESAQPSEASKEPT